MADKKVQMNVTLTDGTVINAGQFTVPEGPAGPEGPGINWKGKWVAGNEVFKDDAYSYQGSSYVANKDNAAGPPTPVNPDWSMLAARGNDGANGTDGAPGTPGTNGKDGVTPLMVISTVIADTKPVNNVQTTIPVASFNRTPLAGEKAVVFFIYSNKRYFIATVQVESVTGALVSNKILSAWEMGIGIASVSVTEVA